MAMEALADTVESATDVATKAKVEGLGGCGGAVYVIGAAEELVVAESVPHALFLHCAPEKLQVTPLFMASFCTLAVKFCVWLTVSVWACGEMATVMG